MLHPLESIYIVPVHNSEGSNRNESHIITKKYIYTSFKTESTMSVIQQENAITNLTGKA